MGLRHDERDEAGCSRDGKNTQREGEQVACRQPKRDNEQAETHEEGQRRRCRRQGGKRALPSGHRQVQYDTASEFPEPCR